MSGTSPKRRVVTAVNTKPRVTAVLVPMTCTICGPKTDVIAIPKGYDEKMSPLIEPLMPHFESMGEKKAERKAHARMNALKPDELDGWLKD